MNTITARIISTSIITPIIAIIFIILAYLIIKNDKDYIVNRFFAVFFISIVVACILQIVYLFNHAEFIIIILNILTNNALTFGLLMLLLAFIAVLKGEKMFFRDKMNLFLIIIISAIIIIDFIWGVFGLQIYSFYIPPGIGVVSGSTKPLWNIPFGVFNIILTQIMILIIIFISIKISRQSKGGVKKKFRLFILGVLILDIHLIFLPITNMNILPILNDYLIIYQIAGILGSFLLFLGLYKKERKTSEIE
jgi:hypothetical protein